jgi:hypothetical protein
MPVLLPGPVIKIVHELVIVPAPPAAAAAAQVALMSRWIAAHPPGHMLLNHAPAIQEHWRIGPQHTISLITGHTVFTNHTHLTRKCTVNLQPSQLLTPLPCPACLLWHQTPGQASAEGQAGKALAALHSTPDDITAAWHSTARHSTAEVPTALGTATTSHTMSVDRTQGAKHTLPGAF